MGKLKEVYVVEEYDGDCYYLDSVYETRENAIQRAVALAIPDTDLIECYEDELESGEIDLSYQEWLKEQIENDRLDFAPKITRMTIQ